jgi:hypothetical protein
MYELLLLSLQRDYSHAFCNALWNYWEDDMVHN